MKRLLQSAIMCSMFLPHFCRGVEPLDTWTSRSQCPAGDYLFAATYGNGLITSVGDNGSSSGFSSVSDDAISWISQLWPSGAGMVDFTDITYGNGLYIAVGLANQGYERKVIYTSTNGINWALVWSGPLSSSYGANSLNGVTYGNRMFVAVGYSGGIVVSTDGIIWSPYNCGTNNWLTRVVCGNGMFVAVGGGGTILTSADGISWSTRHSGTTNSLYGIAYGNGQFIVTGDLGTVMISKNGIDWTPSGSGLFLHTHDGDLHAICYGGGRFVTVGGFWRNELFSTPDGTNWTLRYYAADSRFFGIAYGFGRFVVTGNAILESDEVAPQPPSILTSPQSQNASEGADVTLNVLAIGTGQLFYQWRKNGTDMLGQTNATLTLSSVGAVDSDGYSVLVRNAYGSVLSTTAYLAILADGANGNQPAQIIPSPAPSKPSGPTGLVFVTHGWQPKEFNPSGPPSQPWMVEMTDAIAQQVAASGRSSDWTIESYYWLRDSWTEDPNTAVNNARSTGSLVGKQMAAQGWQRVHLIAHSAGAELIQAITDQLKSSVNPPVVQETFLDPFTGRFLAGRTEYGFGADWADDYFVIDAETDSAGLLLANFPGSTSGKLKWAYNVDVGGTLDAAIPADYIIGSGTADSTLPVNIAPSHDSPIVFYTSTVDGTAPACAAGYGFWFSAEAGGSGNWASHSRNNLPYPLCGTISFSQNQQPVRLDPLFDFGAHPSGTSSSGVNLFGAGAGLTCSLSPQPNAISGGVHPLVPQASTSVPAWLAVAVAITNGVNFVQFDAAFTDTNAAEGLLTVYWNTNQIGIVDERVADTGQQTYRFGLPGVVNSGLYTLSFRLDSFNSTTSSITVTNVSTGFVGVTQPITLGISFTNNAPVLQLTAAANFTYLIQSSTNLTDWTPVVLLLNTNGTAQFRGSAVTNSRAIFYRALMP